MNATIPGGASILTDLATSTLPYPPESSTMTSPPEATWLTAPWSVWQGVRTLSQEFASLPLRAEAKTRLGRASVDVAKPDPPANTRSVARTGNRRMRGLLLCAEDNSRDQVPADSRGPSPPRADRTATSP